MMVMTMAITMTATHASNPESTHVPNDTVACALDSLSSSTHHMGLATSALGSGRPKATRGGFQMDSGRRCSGFCLSADVLEHEGARYLDTIVWRTASRIETRVHDLNQFLP